FALLRTVHWCFVSVAGPGSASARSQDSEFTVLVPAGRAECFFQAAVKNGTMEVEYQVTVWMDMGGLQSRPPTLRIRVEPTEEGDYEICLTTASAASRRRWCSLRSSSKGKARRGGDDEWPAGLEEIDGAFGVQLDDIRESMDSLHKRLERSRQMQTVLRAYEARDRNLLEDNLWRVSFWSCASVLVMLCVALTQVYTVRKLFDDKRRVCT
uniref:Transmembrane p24 trafficking protein 1b n=1 Tax=Salarias fasciatus TaxID=181472 RepID=A0A672I0I9_SALFA